MTSDTIPYRAFSPARILTLARNTFTQLVRMKVFYFLAFFSLLVVALLFAFVRLDPEQELNLFKGAAFGTMRLFAILISITATALLLPRDIEDRTIYTILCKPVPRYEYLAGKFLGVVALIAFSLLVMDVLASAALWLREQQIVQTITGGQTLTAEQQSGMAGEMVNRVRQQGLTWNLHWAAVIILCEACVLTAITLLLSTVASSTIFTILVGICVFFIGQGQALARQYFLDSPGAGLMTRILTFLVSILLPDLQIFSSVEEILRGQFISLDIMARILGFTLMYVGSYFLVAYLMFAEKEL